MKKLKKSSAMGVATQWNNAKRASALLLSFFMMSVLILVAISVSILVVKDLSTVRTIVGGTRAYYTAEGVTELGLYDLKKNLPGFEPDYDLTFLNSAAASLVSLARSSEHTVPCEDQGDEWHALAQNESIQIPLFAQTDSEGNIEPALGDYMNFYVEYYVGQGDPDAFGEVDASSLLRKDVLRWKVLGRTGTVSSPGSTEAMSEYIPLSDGNGIDANGPTTPSLFGPGVNVTLFDGFQSGKFYSSSGATFDSGYPISTFLMNHVYNYLVLTNIITENSPNDTIFYRFRVDNYEPVCEYVELAATGSSDFGSAQQSLQTWVKEGENLPVFDFVIYQTDLSEETP